MVCDNRWQHDPLPVQSRAAALKAEMHGYALMAEKIEDD